MESKSRPKVLLIEDDAQTRELIRRLLKSEFELFEAKNGFAGIRQAIENQPDLILLDIHLPNLDGLRMAAMLKSQDFLTHTKVIAVTGDDSDETKQRALAICDDFILKPIVRKEFVARIKKVLDLK